MPVATTSGDASYVPILTLHGHSRSIAALAFSPCGLYIASAGADAALRVWRVGVHAASAGSAASASGAPDAALRTIRRAHELGINHLAWSSDGRYIATASDDRSVRVWDWRKGTQARLFEGHTSYVFCLAYNPQSTLIASGGFDETIRLWDVRRKTDQCHRTIPAHSEAVTGLDFSRDGATIASCSYDGLIRLWSTSTSHCLKTLLPPDSKPVSYVHFTPSSNHLLAASLDSTIRLWDVPNDRVLKTYTGHRNVKWAIPAALTRATPLSDEEGKRHPRDAEMRHRNLPSIHVVAGSEDNRIYLWDLQTKEVRHVVEGHKEPVICIATHPTQDIIASASLDVTPTIKIWELRGPAARPTDVLEAPAEIAQSQDAAGSEVQPRDAAGSEAQPEQVETVDVVERQDEQMSDAAMQ